MGDGAMETRTNVCEFVFSVMYDVEQIYPELRIKAAAFIPTIRNKELRPVQSLKTTIRKA